MLMRRVIEFPTKVEISKYGGMRNGRNPKLNKHVIAGRGGLSYSEVQGNLYLNFGFNTGKFYYNTTISKGYILQVILDHLMMRPIDAYRPKAYRYHDTQFKGIFKNLTAVEDLHVWGIESHMEEILERLDGRTFFNLTEKQQILMEEQRELLIKRLQAIQFIQPMVIGDMLMKMEEGTWE